MRVAWMMSGFPRFTETFVLHEIRAALKMGTDGVVYPLRRDRVKIVQAAAAEIADRVRHVGFLSPAVIVSQLSWLARAPVLYLRTFMAVLIGTWGSANFFFGALGIFPKVATIARRMQRDGVSHVHCHFATHPAVAGFIIHRLTGIPFSFTAHGSDLLKDRHMLPQKVAEAAFVVAISEYNRALIVRECGGEHGWKVHVVHCGVDPDLFGVQERTGRQALSILCVGRIAPWKGQAHLVDACRLLADGGLGFRCIIVGGGDLAGLQRKVAALGLSEHVEIAGWRSNEEVARLMKSADVLVAPSAPARGKQEGIPVTLMEGMATGMAVVATRLTGIPELVIHERNGLLVPPADPVALANAIERLHREPALRLQLGRAAREHVLANFDLQTNVSKLLAMIERVV